MASATKSLTWRLDEWSDYFARRAGKTLPPMTAKEQTKARMFLRENHYPKPQDCPEENCPKYRTACNVGVCNIATGLAGDF